MPSPKGLTPQRMDALKKGNAIRLERARLKREIRALPREEGVLRVADVFQHSGQVSAMRAFELLKWPCRLQERVVLRWLESAGLSRETEVWDITPQQMGDVVAEMHSYLSQGERSVAA
jgi:hypothetical protein